MILGERTKLAATHAARILRLALEPWESPTWRAERYQEQRSAVAIAIATDVTGVEHAEARLTSIYPQSELTLWQVDRAKAFGSALIAAYRKVDLPYVEFLELCEQLAGERQSVAA